MKNSLKNTCPLYGKTASSGKRIEENGTTKKMFFFENWLSLISIMVSNRRKKILNKSILFPLDRK